MSSSATKTQRWLSAAAAGIVLAFGPATSVRADVRPPAGGEGAVPLATAIVFTGGSGVPMAGRMEVLREGIFAGAVITQTSGDSDGDPLYSLRWGRLPQSYTGPNAHRYHQYRHLFTGGCLAHSGTLLLVKSCQWYDDSQWWAVVREPSAFPASANRHVLIPWDAPLMAATAMYGAVQLTAHTGQQASQWVFVGSTP
ncbi:hypothetical protein ACTMTJ_42630 [Phytohabitans sp. LJ34]|uniref:hypothetical protein n=1 Tax=Phytohabitans sp. LJ34 TaxID=3452217 RepID=UPI003F8969C7